MHKIVEATFLAPSVKLFKIEAPHIARKRKPGQFVILRVHDRGERIPLTIADSDSESGTITLVVQGVGKTTCLLNTRNTGETIADVVGPLGRPSDIELYGRAVVIGGGLGTAIAYPIAKALKEAGNYIYSIIGGRSKDLVILEDFVRAISDETFITTDDGSYGIKGLVTEPLQKLIQDGQKLDLVLAVGPIPMMRAIAEVTRPHGITTIVSLNPIMVDGTGMCGGCRVMVDGQSQFACVDGPEFDAHKVDFAVLRNRNAMYLESEQISLAQLDQETESAEDPNHQCRLKQQHPELVQTPDASQQASPAEK